MAKKTSSVPSSKWLFTCQPKKFTFFLPFELLNNFAGSAGASQAWTLHCCRMMFITHHEVAVRLRPTSYGLDLGELAALWPFDALPRLNSGRVHQVVAWNVLAWIWRVVSLMIPSEWCDDLMHRRREDGNYKKNSSTFPFACGRCRLAQNPSPLNAINFHKKSFFLEFIAVEGPFLMQFDLPAKGTLFDVGKHWLNPSGRDAWWFMEIVEP